MKIQYILGTNSFTPIFDLEKEKMRLLDRQLEMSFPLITSVNLIKDKKQKEIKRIFVGKELKLEERTIKFWQDKYELSFDDITDIYLQGYKKACLLNYKKYDQIIIGVEENDEIVTDYFALREKIKGDCKYEN